MPVYSGTGGAAGAIPPSFFGAKPQRPRGTVPPTAPTGPTGYAPIPLPTGPSAGTDPNWGALINSLIGGLTPPSGMVDPLAGIPLAQRALIQYGAVPSGLGGLTNLGPAFDAGTRSLAQANTASGISLTARLAQTDADRRREIVNSLAAHGILDSGETGYQQGREQTAYAQAQADSLSKLLDYLSGINSGIGGFLGWQQQMAALQGLGATPPSPTDWASPPQLVGPTPYQPAPGFGGPSWDQPVRRPGRREKLWY